MSLPILYAQVGSEYFKKVSWDLILRPQGFFSVWSLDHSVSFVPMSNSLTPYCNQAASTPHLCKQTSYPLLKCKQPASPPLLCNCAESPLLRAQMPSLAYRYGNQHFPHCYILQKKIQSTYTKARFTSNPNDFTPKSKKIMPNSINPSRHPGLGLINSLSFCAINPELHKPWEEKDKRVIKHVKEWLTS